MNACCSVISSGETFIRALFSAWIVVVVVVVVFAPTQAVLSEVSMLW